MKADVFFIKRFLDNKQLGIYATAALVVENLGFIASVMSTLLLPRLIRIEGVRERFLVSRRQTFIASVVLLSFTLLSFVFAEFILSIFIKSNAILCVNVFRLLLVANFFLSVQSVNVQFLNSIGVPSRLILYWFIASFSNIILTVQDLARPFAISQPAISHHLKVLEEAGLIETRVAGTARPRRLRPEAVEAIWGWMSEFRREIEARYVRLDAVLDEMMQEERRDDTA